MLTVFLMKSPCFFGIGVKWKVPILDFSACLHNPHRCNMRLGHSHAFEPTGVCLGWFAPAAAAPGSPLDPSASGHFQPSEALCCFLYIHTVIKLNKLLELYSQIFTGLISCGQLLHFSEPISLPAKQAWYSNLSHGIVRQRVKGVWNIRSAHLPPSPAFLPRVQETLKNCTLPRLQSAQQ